MAGISSLYKALHIYFFNHVRSISPPILDVFN